MGNMTKTPFSGTMERETNLLEIIHTDVRGPMNIEARGGYRYFLTFINDLSRYGYIYLMKHKSETLEKFKEFQRIFELRVWFTFEAMRNSFATHATRNTTTKWCVRTS